MKALKNIRQGTSIKIDDDDLRYYIRGKSKDGRVEVQCYHKAHGRVRHLDRYLPSNNKVELI